MPTAVDTLDKLLEDAFKRISSLEQRIASPTFVATPGSSPNFTKVTINNDYDIDNIVPSVPQNVELDSSALYDNIYITVDWDAPATGYGAQYWVECARRISPGVYDNSVSRYTQGLSEVFDGLLPDTIYGVRVTAISRTGVVGPSSDWVEINTAIDSTIPLPPTNITVTAGLSSLLVKWDENTAQDVKWGRGVYEVSIGTDSAVTVNVRTIRTAATITGFTDLDTGTQYWVKVSTIDSSGNQGAATIVGPYLTGYVLGSDMLVEIGGGNALLNSNFADPLGLVSWSAYNDTIAVDGTQTAPVFGSVLKATNNNTQTAFGAAQHGVQTPRVGDKWTFSAYVKSAQRARLYISWGAGGDVAQAYQTVSSTSFQRLVWTQTVPAGANFMSFYVMFENPDALANGKIGYVANVQAELGDIVTAYAPRPDEILNSKITTNLIADDAVTTPKLVANSVVTAKIAAGAVVAGKIAADAVGATEIAADSIVSAHIDTVGLDAAVIKFGTMDGDRIAANTAVFNILEANTSLTTKDLFIGAGGQIIVGTSSTGVVFNSQGLRLMLGGVTQVNLDVSGSASFKGYVTATAGELQSLSVTGTLTMSGSGTFKTGSSGARIELSNTFVSTGRWYTGHASETAPAFVGVSQVTSSASMVLSAPTISTGALAGNSPAAIHLIHNTTVGQQISLLAVRIRTEGEAWFTGVVRGQYGGTSAIHLLTRSSGNAATFDWDGKYFKLYIDSTNVVNLPYQGLVFSGESFQNGWGNFGSGYFNVAHAVDSFDIVHLRGLMSGGTLGAVAFNLPSGYRPASASLHVVYTAGGVGYVNIETNGNVTPFLGGNGWVTLDGITFSRTL